jgi:hypothetical protein
LRDRDVGFLLVAYFMTDVERSLKFRIYRDETFLYNSYQERSDQLIEDLFGQTWTPTSPAGSQPGARHSTPSSGAGSRTAIRCDPRLAE